MITRYGGNNWHVTSTPSRARLTERLSNGQYLSMWFWRGRVQDQEKQIDYVWTVGLYIGSKKGAASWRRIKKPSRQTGECGLEGLRIAMKVLLDFAANIGTREELQIGAEDKKRKSAYNYLLRYPGFTEGTNGLFYRRPDNWEWIPEKESAE